MHFIVIFLNWYHICLIIPLINILLVLDKKGEPIFPYCLLVLKKKGGEDFVFGFECLPLLDLFVFDKKGEKNLFLCFYPFVDD